MPWLSSPVPASLTDAVCVSRSRRRLSRPGWKRQTIYNTSFLSHSSGSYFYYHYLFIDFYSQISLPFTVIGSGKPPLKTKQTNVGISSVCNGQTGTFSLLPPLPLSHHLGSSSHQPPAAPSLTDKGAGVGKAWWQSTRAGGNEVWEKWGGSEKDEIHLKLSAEEDPSGQTHSVTGRGNHIVVPYLLMLAEDLLCAIDSYCAPKIYRTSPITTMCQRSPVCYWYMQCAEDLVYATDTYHVPKAYRAIDKTIMHQRPVV